MNNDNMKNSAADKDRQDQQREPRRESRPFSQGRDEKDQPRRDDKQNPYQK